MLPSDRTTNFSGHGKSTHNSLICIYTCEVHRKLLGQFHQTPVGQYLRSMPDAKILEVYANPDIQQSFVSGDELTLKTIEEYEALSLKTFAMMNYCVKHYRFDQLLKIDVTTALRQLDESEYVGRKPINQEKLVAFLRRLKSERHYDGFLLHAHATRKNAEDWAAKKGRSINYEKVFGNRPMLPYFSGKCYVVSQRFAKFISENGLETAREHAQYFLGSEDLMVGRLFQLFQMNHIEDNG